LAYSNVANDAARDSIGRPAVHPPQATTCRPRFLSRSCRLSAGVTRPAHENSHLKLPTRHGDAGNRCIPAAFHSQHEHMRQRKEDAMKKIITGVAIATMWAT